MSQPDLRFSSSLSEFHDTINELLHSQETKLETVNHKQRRWAHEISEATLKMAESCASAKELTALAKDHIQKLQTSLRRTTTTDRHKTTTFRSNFSPHRLPRKQLKKAIFKRLNSLKGANYTLIIGGSCNNNKAIHTEDQQTRTLATIAELLRQVRDTTLSTVQSLLTLIAVPEPNKKISDHRKECYGVLRIKLTRIDSLDLWERNIIDVSDVRVVMKRLEEVEMAVDDMENEMEGIYRRLIRTRASLLNILTC